MTTPSSFRTVQGARLRVRVVGVGVQVEMQGRADTSSRAL